jgi:pimeloyl-ACP methyl ester carboxylesterase/ketosteroid isomerase-like protein
MRILAAVLACALTMHVFADATEDVRQTEIAFAKAFADQDKAKFFAFVADDAVFISPGLTLRGKQAVVDAWSRFFEGPRAPFAWTPDRVSISADGTLGLSSGPVYDASGNHSGNFQSTWRKQQDGTWKIQFDGSGPSPAPFVATALPIEEGFVTTADGVKLFYRKTGRGPAVIAPLDFVLHDRLKQFADIATVITYDMRNRGRSSRSTDENTWTIEQDVRDLEAVRAHFNVERFVPVGYSYLGKMVMMYAIAHPQRVRRIVQIAPIENRRDPRNQLPDFGAPKDDLVAWQTMDPAKDPKAYCLAQWNVLRYFHVGDPRKVAGFDVDGACAYENEWPVNVNRHFAKLLTSGRVLTDEELQTVKVPVLTIHGTSDRAATYEGGRTWVSKLPDARLVTVPGAGHAMWVDEPVTMFAAMRAFLRNEWPLGSEDL